MITRRSQSEVVPIKLHDYISIPSEVHVYSLGIEYMKNWFLEQFDTGYFKTVYVNGKHIFDDYRRFNRERLTKQVKKPAVAIIPNVDYAYNRENVDLALGGRHILNRRSRYFNDALIQDREKNIFLNMVTKITRMNFTFRVRVSTRAEQIDLYNFMKYAFRVGATQGKVMSYDFNIPKEILLNIAQSAGFELEEVIKEDTLVDMRVKDIIGFLKYINGHSMYPVLYKMRTINGNDDFFIRIPGMYTHISNLDELNIDDGERVDQIDNNFHIEMNCVLDIPSPQYYFYNSRDMVDSRFKYDKKFAGLYEFRNMSSPEKDENGWNQYLSTSYFDDDHSVKKIPFRELLENHDFMQVIQLTIDSGMSPAIFVNMKLYNNQMQVPIKVDWENFEINLLNKHDLEIDESYLTIYVDLEYMNNQLIAMREIDKNRLQETNDQKLNGYGL